jgi:hypothetical protein
MPVRARRRAIPQERQILDRALIVGLLGASLRWCLHGISGVAPHPVQLRSRIPPAIKASIASAANVIPPRFAPRAIATICLPIPVFAHACTVCHSNTAQLVRAGIFNAGFFHTLWLVTLPIPILALAVTAVHFGMPDIALEPESAERQFGARRKAESPYSGIQEAD